MLFLIHTPPVQQEATRISFESFQWADREIAHTRMGILHTSYGLVFFAIRWIARDGFVG